MKRGFAPLIILVIVLALGIGVFFVYKNFKSTNSMSSTTTPTAPSTQTAISPTSQSTTGSMSATFFDMIKAGQSLECTWQAPSQTSMAPGNVWFGMGKARSQLKTTPAAGQAIEADAIMRDGKMYAWVMMGGAGTYGFMMNQADVMSMGKNLTPQQLQQAQQYQQKVNFNCHPWTYNEAQFTVPSNVNFTSQ